jgi:hypothetical protein
VLLPLGDYPELLKALLIETTLTRDGGVKRSLLASDIVSLAYSATY